MRISNQINIVDMEKNALVKTKSIAKEFSTDPKPDWGAYFNNKLFVTLRGITPLSGIPGLVNEARTPGVAALKVPDNTCKNVNWSKKDLLPMNENGVASDPHGLAVIRLN